MMTKSKLKKYEIRKLWILKALLDCDQWTQKDIKKVWYLLSVNHIYSEKCDAIRGIKISEKVKTEAWEKLLKKYKNYVTKDQEIDVPEDEVEKIKEEFKEYAIERMLKKIDKTKKNFDNIDITCKSDISNIMNELKKKKIIKDDTIIKVVVPKHAKPIETAYTLIENYNVLFLILDEINNPLTPYDFKNSILNHLMGSEFLKRVVNKELVETIEMELRLSLNNNDKKLLLFCLRKYPTVLYNTLKQINNPHPLIPIFVPQKHTNGFILDVKNWAYNDMKSGNSKVKYEITVTIKDDDGKTIKHTNSNIIHVPEDKKYREMSSRAFKEAILGKDVLKFLKEDKPIKNEDLPEYEKMVDQHREFHETLNKMNDSQTEYVQNEIKDETIFIKDNGEKIDFLDWYVLEDVAPY